MYGIITLWNNARGWGFITARNRELYFFHISNFHKGGESDVPILEGRVRFDVGPALSVGKKPQALNVQYIHNIKAAGGVQS
jgi:cold shock CspA family protein